MAIPGKDGARYPSLQAFQSFSLKDRNYAPSFTNLFSFHIGTPTILRSTEQLGVGNTSTIGQTSTIFTSEIGKLQNCLNFYCKTVNLPSKQLTTGQVVNVGSAYKYGTGTSYSQINATFLMPRSQHTRNYFERWMSLLSPDSNQYVEHYDHYVSPRIMIYKWERGGGGDVSNINEIKQAMRNLYGTEYDEANYIWPKQYKCTAAWELRKAFPYNIGSIQLNNEKARTMSMTVGFFYERYRFWVEDEFDDPGVRSAISIPGDGSINPASDGLGVWAGITGTIQSMLNVF
tara:strand:+ start:1096 stop:1959 length:864 start_codon:yes stop_codon:yes gene_type:complete